MNSKTLFPVVAAAATLVNFACVATATAQVKAALTRDVDRATAQPAHGVCNATSDSFGAIKCTLYSVPAGKRLVVETVSYQMATASGTPVYSVVFGEDTGSALLRLGDPNVFSLTPMFAYEQGGAHVYTGTQALLMYVDENKIFAGGGVRGGMANYVQEFSFSGYLVDK